MAKYCVAFAMMPLVELFHILPSEAFKAKRDITADSLKNCKTDIEFNQRLLEISKSLQEDAHGPYSMKEYLIDTFDRHADAFNMATRQYISLLALLQETLESPLEPIV